MTQQWRRLYDRVAPVLVIFCLMASLFASVGIYYQDRQRDADRAELLKCFDQYAELQSSGSAAVREASVAKDEAMTARDDALNAEGMAFQVVVDEILAGDLTPAAVKRLADTLAERARAARRLDVAQDALDEARRENPIPEPPSEFCAVKP